MTAKTLTIDDLVIKMIGNLATAHAKRRIEARWHSAATNRVVLLDHARQMSVDFQLDAADLDIPALELRDRYIVPAVAALDSRYHASH